MKHLLFYFVETTLITFLLWSGLFLAVNALKRMGYTLRLRRIVPVVIWIGIATIDVIMSEALGPEFTLHYYLGIWILIGGGALWLVAVTRQAAASFRSRNAKPIPRAAED